MGDPADLRRPGRADRPVGHAHGDAARPAGGHARPGDLHPRAARWPHDRRRTRGGCGMSALRRLGPTLFAPVTRRRRRRRHLLGAVMRGAAGRTRVEGLPGDGRLRGGPPVADYRASVVILNRAVRVHAAPGGGVVRRRSCGSRGGRGWRRRGSSGRPAGRVEHGERVGQADQLVQVGGVRRMPRPRRGLPELVPDRGLRADVDATGRVRGERQPGRGGDLAADDQLLWLPPERATARDVDARSSDAVGVDDPLGVAPGARCGR